MPGQAVSHQVRPGPQPARGGLPARRRSARPARRPAASRPGRLSRRGNRREGRLARPRHGSAAARPASAGCAAQRAPCRGTPAAPRPPGGHGLPARLRRRRRSPQCRSTPRRAPGREQHVRGPAGPAASPLPPQPRPPPIQQPDLALAGVPPSPASPSPRGRAARPAARSASVTTGYRHASTSADPSLRAAQPAAAGPPGPGAAGVASLPGPIMSATQTATIPKNGTLCANPRGRTTSDLQGQRRQPRCRRPSNLAPPSAQRKCRRYPARGHAHWRGTPAGGLRRKSGVRCDDSRLTAPTGESGHGLE